MERHQEIILLLLFLALPHACNFNETGCSTFPDNVSCYNDYNQNITCVWNSTTVPHHADTVCTIDAESEYGYRNSCRLEPFDVSTPMLQKCSIFFKRESNFQSFHELIIELSCNNVKLLNFSYWPVCHIKLNPPPKPEINLTTVHSVNFTAVSWLTQVQKHTRLPHFKSELQWKQADQPWNDPPIHKECAQTCTTNLDANKLIRGERYEARTRVQPTKYWSVWSDWSPTTSWVSPIGRAKPPPPDITGGVLSTFACAVVLTLLLVLLKTGKTTWIYIVKIFRSPPLPKALLHDANFQNWLSPHLTSESFTFSLKPVEIMPVEVTSTVDDVSPSGPEEKIRPQSSFELNSSNFSNPSYSHLAPIPVPVSSLTAGNLEACSADTPYGPVCCHGEGKNAEKDRAERSGKEVEILQLCKGSAPMLVHSEPMLVISDYEKAETPQVECFRLQSLDSGVCSGEEVSQESLEADSINVSDCHDEEPEGKQDSDRGHGKEVDFRKLFASSGGISGFVQVCSGYKQVQNLQADTSELPSLDSGISSGGEEHPSQEESLEDVDKTTESTSLLFSPTPVSSSVLACSFPSFVPLPFNFSEAGLSPVALMPTARPLEPSGDGYMPVRQEHC